MDCVFVTYYTHDKTSRIALAVDLKRLEYLAWPSVSVQQQQQNEFRPHPSGSTARSTPPPPHLYVLSKSFFTITTGVGGWPGCRSGYLPPDLLWTAGWIAREHGRGSREEYRGWRMLGEQSERCNVESRSFICRWCIGEQQKRQHSLN